MDVERRWHGTILAQRAVMIPDVSYRTRICGAGSICAAATNCDSCGSDIRACLQAGRPKKAA